MKPKTNKVQLSPIRELYMERKEALMSESEAMEINITNEFWREIKDKIYHKEINNIALQGEVRTGKSTVNLKICWEGNKYLKKLGKVKIDDWNKYMAQHIFSDQTEFLRFANQGMENRFIAIDEYNRMAEGGLNASTESQYYEAYSEMFAVRGIHRGLCSPSMILDKGATIILDVIGKNLKKQITQLKLTYREPSNQVELVLGHVNIYVGDVIKQDWYQWYLKKKEKRLQLLDKHGVRDIRPLETAKFVMQSYQELLPLSKSGAVLNSTINMSVQKILRENKMIYSIWAMGQLGDTVNGLLSLTRDKYKYLEKYNKLIIKSKGIITPQIEALKESVKIVTDLLGKAIIEEEKKMEIYRKYRSIE